MLYRLPAADFHDVTVGNNGGETAAVGYDLASGLGSVRFDRAVVDAKGLGNKPPTANFGYTTSGLNVTFNDTSTDSDGTVTGWKWNFGDGSTPTTSNTRQNPIHDYAAAGTYKVTEIVTDNQGATATTSKTLTVAGSAMQQLLGNPGFESGTAPWTVTANASHPVIACNTAEPAADGSCAAWA